MRRAVVLKENRIILIRCFRISDSGTFLKMKALDLDVLTMIVVVADTGSISRAADLVHRSQSAVSMQVKTLENALVRRSLLASRAMWYRRKTASAADDICAPHDRHA